MQPTPRDEQRDTVSIACVSALVQYSSPWCSLSMLNIRSYRLSGVPSRLARTKISRTSASDLRSGLSLGRFSSMTETFRMLGFFVSTSSNLAILTPSLASSSSAIVSVLADLLDHGVALSKAGLKERGKTHHVFRYAVHVSCPITPCASCNE